MKLFHHSNEAIAEQLLRIETKLGIIFENQEKLMIDTSKLLAAVTAENTQVASLITLSNGQSATMKDLSSQLASAIAANDPNALAQVQADLDKAATDLSTETAAVTSAIAANTPQAQTPAAGSAAPATGLGQVAGATAQSVGGQTTGS